jgi:hypothetical protein
LERVVPASRCEDRSAGVSRTSRSRRGSSKGPTEERGGHRVPKRFHRRPRRFHRWLARFQGRPGRFHRVPGQLHRRSRQLHGVPRRLRLHRLGVVLTNGCAEIACFGTSRCVPGSFSVVVRNPATIKGSCSLYSAREMTGDTGNREIHELGGAWKISSIRKTAAGVEDVRGGAHVKSVSEPLERATLSSR